MVEKKMIEFRIFLKNQKTGAENYEDIPLKYPPNANRLIDSINQRMKIDFQGERKYSDYNRIYFEWNHNQINLTNPSFTGQDVRPFFGPYSQGYEATKNFLGDYYAEQEEEQQQPTQPEKQSGEEEWIKEVEPSGVMPLPHQGKSFDSFATAVDWETRWKAAMARSRQIEQNDQARAKIRYQTFVASHPGAQAIIDAKTPLDWPKAIYTVVTNAIDRIGKLMQMIPEDIAAMIDRASLNLQIIFLAIERLATVANEILKLLQNAFKLFVQLDWEGAAKMANKWIASQQKVLDEGIKAGLLDQNGDPIGLEKWKTPSSTRPNDPEELKLWLAVSGLAHSPLFGHMIEDQMRFQILAEYQRRTGVGIPDQMAWMKYVLGNDVGVTVPIQDIADMAGQIPDWFLQHADKMKKVASEIHEKQHEELKLLKK